MSDALASGERPALPIALYQTTNKFRDEVRPRFGLMRAREFRMNDLYTADASRRGAQRTYAAVLGAYEALFGRIGLAQHFCLAAADTGLIGGDHSHEVHILAGTLSSLVCVCVGGEIALLTQVFGRRCGRRRIDAL